MSAFTRSLPLPERAHHAHARTGGEQSVQTLPVHEIRPGDVLIGRDNDVTVHSIVRRFAAYDFTVIMPDGTARIIRGNAEEYARVRRGWHA